MLDRRTAVKREWSVWWRYALTLAAVALAALLVRAATTPLGPLVGLAILFLLGYLFLQLIVLGVATNTLVRFHVRTLHVWRGAAIANAPLLATAVLPLQYWASCCLLGAGGSIAWVIVVSRMSMRINDPRLGHLCTRCFYDLHGLTTNVCPECGVAITAPAAASTAILPAAER